MPRTLIVVVNYRSAALTVDCLASLADEVAGMNGATSVTVVENDSRDGSAETLAAAISQRGWSRWATLLPLDRNGGFAAGNNAAIRPALASSDPPDYVLLLNPDTVVRPGAVRRLVEFLERRPEVGIAGSRLENPDGTPQQSAFRFFSLPGEFANGVRLGLVSRLLNRWLVAPPVRDRAHPTDWLAGASMLVRREVFRDVGLMDEGYFLYYEETDFCLQARRRGWEVWYVPDSRVVHLVGQSTGVTDTRKAPKRVPRYWFESRRRYFAKNHGPGYRVCADLAWSAGFALWRVRRRLQRKPDGDPPRLLADFVRFSFLNSCCEG